MRVLLTTQSESQPKSKTKQPDEYDRVFPPHHHHPPAKPKERETSF
jgi:hypothetical protein